jgi:hypothetical protein
MRQRITFAVVAVAALVLLAGQPASGSHRSRTMRGQFSLVNMVHTTAYAGADIPDPNPRPWNGASSGGPFRYFGIACTGAAPVNNISTNLTTYNSRLPGSRSPASTRSHPFEFVANGDRLEGRITFTVCKLGGGPTATPDPVADQNKEKIFVSWQAKVESTTPEEVSYRGKFRITGGTGVYNDLTGGGEMSGYLFCFAAAGCASPSIGGQYRDGQYTMQGHYRDPTTP